MAVDWLNLPQELVTSIARCIVSMEDFIAFGAVCKLWRSTATKENFTSRFTNHFPLLMFPPNREDGKVYNIKTDKSYQLCLPEFKERPRRQYFSCLGWLLTISEDREITLLHPLNGAEIKLPHMKPDHPPRFKLLNLLQQYYKWELHKFALSSSPSWTSDYLVSVICLSNRWAFWRPGEDEWTCIKTDNGMMDVTYYKDKFYAVDILCNIFVCDLEDPNTPNIRIVASPLAAAAASLRMVPNLVESDGALLVVLRPGPGPCESDGDLETKFRVFKVPFDTENLPDWSDLEVKNLGNRSIFLGYYGDSSISVEACNYSGCKSNCIYFLDTLRESWSETHTVTCIFHMEDGKIELLRKNPQTYGSARELWIEPSF